MLAMWTTIGPARMPIFQLPLRGMGTTMSSDSEREIVVKPRTARRTAPVLCLAVAVVCTLSAMAMSGEQTEESRHGNAAADRTAEAPYLVVLGIAQAGGYPQAGCDKPCCAKAWAEPRLRRSVVCLAVIDPHTRQRWLLDCSPDFREQLQALNQVAPPRQRPT